MNVRLRIALLLLACIALAVLRSSAGTRLDSFTIDEPWHAVAGAAYVQHGDFALNPEHPPLVKLWVGLWLGPGFVVPPTPVLVDKDSEREFVETVMYADHDDRAVQSRLRMAMWSFHALLLAALAALLWRLFGPAWALGAMAVLAIEPSVGAYLPVVMTDLPVAVALAVAALSLALLLERRTWPRAVLLGVALGVALGTKFSALPALAGLAALAALAWAWQARRHAGRESLTGALQLGLAAALAIALLWAQYGLRFEPRADGSEGYNRPIAAKFADINSDTPRELLEFAHAHRLLPESYLWGLADTVRVGLEGRGEPGVFLWGRFFEGRPPWFAWPAFIAGKLPLALMALSLLGLVLAWRSAPDRGARLGLLALATVVVAYGASLLGAQSAYAGSRHAMPVILVLLIACGAVAHWAWRQRDRRWLALPAGLWLLALASTLTEPRLWEYHNVLAGGTEGAHRRFSNESVELGQRLHEIEDFVRREVLPGGETVYLDYWAYGSKAWIAARGLPMRQRVESIHDDNPEGHFKGWFLKNVEARQPLPALGWDPAEGLKGLEPVVRFGNVELWRGEQTRPRGRAWAMFDAVRRYVYIEGGDDWALVARRAEEILAVAPAMYTMRLELANARLRLGEREAARQAYAFLLAQDDPPLPPVLVEPVRSQIDRLDGDEPTENIPSLRNPMIE